LTKLTYDDSITYRFTTLSTLQPGIMSVYESILSPGGASLRTQDLPESLIGATYKDARRSIDKAVVCGYIRGGKIQLLPNDNKVRCL
jgi:hypothetical protein